ncbi:hypothetical protein ASPWEDRAFT_740224 [Aspergillus wentii DTO 134E9]|uniref:endo-1,3(4)-beta-glucanase n=1 Tax=Aspergillus wentii DTO 134E9 TaxID=1073089 RepID=A0A1L9RKJ7_ASPWE|nr:uncharacterized protein ASPWEDRAFT_740224 [Aspergillus wentii DTO 134E9]KAI9924860.1 hypothetical protein MW887_006717 [Aspergillus wentii]OJJ35367.1 hypothetical protein ASPWEDRAFT_740224 [Aspergillus wentii DTO 134E9]
MPFNRPFTSPPSKPEDHHPLPWYNPRGWSNRKKIICLGITILIFVAIISIGIIVGAIVGTRPRYPDYVPLEYKLVDTYAGTSFFDQFDYFSAEDPTHGFVHYVDRSVAENLNLTYATDESVILKVDTSEKKALTGRRSVRIESKNHYDTGLFIFDILHTPYGCGTWPALWLTDGYNWPANGEIDILETTNKANEGNTVTLHSTAGCHVEGKRKQTGSAEFLSCEDTNGNAGCGVQGTPDTYGEELNDNGGGVYALELRNAGIRAWFFPRHLIPNDIANSTPDPSTWGTALADFPNTHCDISSHFSNQSIIANIDLCGELGAQPQLYTELYNCPGKCEDVVANNPQRFLEAYWEFSSFKVYQSV